MPTLTGTLALPDPGLSFVGREEELRVLGELLDASPPRIVTLAGPGGVGKTRLAIEVGRRAAASGVDVAFADLDALPDASGLPIGIADALRIRLGGEVDTERQLLAAVESIEGLLVLDNFEHLVDGAHLIGKLHRAAPGLRLLITSRVVLGLRNEWVYQVEGLPIEVEGNGGPRAIPSVALLLDRMRQSSARGGTDDLDAIAAICRTVEGNPLAIEMAASWTRTLAIAEIAAEAQRDIARFESPLRDMPERHRSVRALFDRSWSLLEQADRDILVGLAAFEGGFTREAAEKVAGATTPRLAGLVDKSLVQFRGGGRYRLHELIRQCILEHAGGSLPEEARRAHIRYFSQFLRERKHRIYGHGQMDACAQIDAEIHNVRAAFNAAVAMRDDEGVTAVGETMDWFLVVRGRHKEGLDLAERLLEYSAPFIDELPQLYASAQASKGWQLIRFGRLGDAEAAFRESRRIYDHYEIPAPFGPAEWPESGLAIVALTRGEYDTATELATLALDLTRAAGDDLAQAIPLYTLGNVAFARGDLGQARTYTRESLALSERHGHEWFAAYLHGTLANLAFTTGNLPESEAEAEAAYRIRDALNDDEGKALALLQLARVSRARDDLDRSERLAREALGLYNRQGDTGGIVRALAALATFAALRGEATTAAERALRAIGLVGQISDATPIQLEVLCAAADVFAVMGDSAGCADLIEFVVGQPEVSYETRARAQALLERLPAAEAPHGRLRQLSLETALEAVTRALGQAARGESAPEVTHDDELTAREREILDCLARGATNREIGTQLGISTGTIKWFTARIYDKLGVRNRTEAVAAARARGLLA